MSVIPPTQNGVNFSICGRKIGNGPYSRFGKPADRYRVFIIAELSVNHNGDVRTAADMIECAAACGVDAVKLQLRDLEACYGDLAKHPESASGALANYFPILKQTALPLDAYASLKKVAEECKVGFMVTPFDAPSVDRLEKLGVEAYKVASCDAVNPYVLDPIIASGKPMIVSTGMCSESEIFTIVDYLVKKGVRGRFALMHTISSYPAAFEDCQLHLIPRYKHHFGIPVGWSGHERGVAVSVAAAALGADIIERHFTLDRTLPGPDQAASLEPEGMRKLVVRVRAFEAAYGDPVETRLRPRSEYACEEVMRKSLVAARDITEGEIVGKEDFSAVGPGRGVPPILMMRLGDDRWKAVKALRRGQRLAKGDVAPAAKVAVAK